jgi:hypothetical protein
MSRNLSYCRFENTLSDLRDCREALFDKGLQGLSSEERDAAFALIKVCGDIFEGFEEEKPEDYEDEEDDEEEDDLELVDLDDIVP